MRQLTRARSSDVPQDGHMQLAGRGGIDAELGGQHHAQSLVGDQRNGRFAFNLPVIGANVGGDSVEATDPGWAAPQRPVEPQ